MTVSHEPEPSVGSEIHRFIRRLYPLCRSITGAALRDSLEAIGEVVPIRVSEVPSRTRVLDWTIPREWNIRDAYIKDAAGNRIVDFRKSNLHVVQYSVPVRATMTLEELRPRLHSLPEHPEWIPYRTTYYRDEWGFCLPHRQLMSLGEGPYEVCIDSELSEGSLSYGEVFLQGDLDAEVLISAHVCHPSLCNDNLSAVALATFLAREMSRRRRRYSYRFLFAPATIGAIAWLARNEGHLGRVSHGLVLSCVGDSGPFTYKLSRHGGREIDRAVTHVLGKSGEACRIRPFTPYGNDERQFCSPGFDLPIGCLMRTPNGEFAEYHTSADDLAFVTPEALEESYERCLEVFEVLEANRSYLNLSPRGEPQLGRRGLYGGLAGASQLPATEMAMLWVLNLSDGENDLLGIAERSGLEFASVLEAAKALEGADLLAPGPDGDSE